MHAVTVILASVRWRFPLRRNQKIRVPGMSYVAKGVLPEAGGSWALRHVQDNRPDEATHLHPFHLTTLRYVTSPPVHRRLVSNTLHVPRAERHPRRHANPSLQPCPQDVPRSGAIVNIEH